MGTVPSTPFFHVYGIDDSSLLLPGTVLRTYLMLNVHEA